MLTFSGDHLPGSDGFELLLARLMMGPLQRNAISTSSVPIVPAAALMALLLSCTAVAAALLCCPVTHS